MRFLRSLYDEIVETYATLGAAHAFADAAIYVVFGALLAFFSTLIIIGLVAALPWTLALVPLGWIALVVARSVRRDADALKSKWGTK